MKLCIVMVLALGSLAAGDARDDAKDELKKLEGIWVRIYVEADGKKLDDVNKKPEDAIRLTIRGDKFTTRQGGGEVVSTFKLDPTKKPKHIDLSETVEGKDKPKPLPGIYELTDDVLKLCFLFPFEEKGDKLGMRPTEFSAKTGSDHVLEVYRREKK